MKVLHINTYDVGGAAKACLRLHQGLLNTETESKVLLKSSKNNLPITAVFKYFNTKVHSLERLSEKVTRSLNQIGLFKERQESKFLKGRPDGFYPFTFPFSKTDITDNLHYKQADIIHLHWVANFLDWKSFFKKNSKPVVWTMHDMNPFTGGCHASLDCNKYMENCTNCPQLQGTINPDYSKYLLGKKMEFIAMSRSLFLVSPSTWLMQCSQNSLAFARFPHFCIPNALDVHTYKYIDKVYSRQLLGLPIEKKIILFIAKFQEPLKGYSYIKSAFDIIKNDYGDIVLCNLGSSKPNEEHLINIPSIDDERFMSVVYSASDLYVTPSLAESFGQTVIESQCCGTPVIAFPIGGLKDLIVDAENGFLCPEISVQSLKATIQKFLENPEIFDRKKIAQETQKKYALDVQAKKYIRLYDNILNELS